jgi:hypothetical protein
MNAPAPHNLAYILLIFNFCLFSFPEWIAVFTHGKTTQRYYYKVPFNRHRIIQKNLSMDPAARGVSNFAKGVIAFRRYYSL